MTDRLTGERREVDIVIEHILAGHNLLVSVECIDQTRKATVEWVERMAGKHEHLPTDKLVLVSRSGFWSTALYAAKQRGIDTLSITEASAADWNIVINLEELEVRHQRLYPTDFHVLVPDDAAPLVAGLTVRDLRVRPKGADSFLPMSHLVELALASPDVRRLVDEASSADEWRQPLIVPNVCVLTPGGSEIEGALVGFTVRYAESLAHIQLEYGSLSETNIAFGSSQTTAGEVVAAVVEQQDEAHPATLVLKIVPGYRDAGEHVEWRKA